MRIPIFAVSLIVAVLGVPGAARAQAPDSSCDYARCSLTIIPRLTALDVVRGAEESRVTSLPFLVPRNPVRIFSANAEARDHASRAFRVRRVAAVLTDLGIGVAAVSGIRAAGSRDRRAVGIQFSVAAALVAASVPIHFRADAELSRAVRAYNDGLVR